MSTQAWKRGTGPSVLRGMFARPARVRAMALLWDMDGLLVDSEPLWTIAERELFARWGQEFTPSMKAEMVGNRLDLAVPVMIRLGGPAAEHESPTEVAAWLLQRMTELFAAELLLMPGASRLLGEAEAAGVPQALVSSSYRVLVDAVLAGLPGHPFAVSVAGDEVARSKPDPEPYEKALEALGFSPSQAVVLEDSPTGARAGDAAGARVLYCPSVHGAGEPDPGWWPVRSLQDVSLAGLQAWLRR